MKRQTADVIFVCLVCASLLFIGGCLHAWFGETDWGEVFAAFWGNR